MWEVRANTKEVNYQRLQSHMSWSLDNFNCTGLDWAVMIQHLALSRLTLSSCPNKQYNREKTNIFALTDLCKHGIIKRMPTLHSTLASLFDGMT